MKEGARRNGEPEKRGETGEDEGEEEKRKTYEVVGEGRERDDARRVAGEL